MRIATGTYVFVPSGFSGGFLRLGDKNWYVNTPLGWEMASTKKISELEAEYQKYLKNTNELG